MRGSVQAHWFTTEQFEPGTGPGAVGPTGRTPGSIAHAKQIGTNLTACGENAFTWSKL